MLQIIFPKHYKRVMFTVEFAEIYLILRSAEL